MVFEINLQTVKDLVTADSFALAVIDLDVLIAQVEVHYATLLPGAKAEWEDTRLELGHAKSHLSAAALATDGQKQACLNALNRITVI